MRPVNLALQGGGVHGAFTCGVLERVLHEDNLQIAWISGASAGAVNAVAVAHGLAHGGPDAAIATLRSVWAGVIDAQVPDLIKLNPFMAGIVRSASVPKMGSVLSPYEFNPMNFDPLRKLLAQRIDFEAIRKTRPCELLISATDVATGRARIFRTHEVSVDVVLASACLPMLHHAVVIEGRAYWDGGFSANPDLITLASSSPADDTLIVQLNPTRVETAPRTLREISDRAETITFNQAFIRDIEEIVRARETAGQWQRRGGNVTARLKRHRFHVIEAGRHTANLHSDTKIKADAENVTYLIEAGRGEAHKWFEREGANIGRVSSVDLRSRYLSD